jgi:hypothetical protein
MNKMKHRIKLGILFVPLFIGGVFLFTLLLMLLWNAVLPAAIPAIKAISYWQAMGILVLSKLLFGFNRGWSGRRGQWKQRMAERWGTMKEMEQKWNNMTPEERENFKAEWKNRCGGRWGRHTKTDSPGMAAE